MDIIKKSGAWFSYDGERLGQGRDNVRKYMMENPDFAKMIDKQVRDRLKENPNFKVGKNN